MPSFSQRNGLEPLEKPIQEADLDDRTKNRLWNYCSSIVDEWVKNDPHDAIFARLFFDEFLGENMSNMPRRAFQFRAHVEQNFLSSSYNEAYEFLEFIANFLTVLKERIDQQKRYGVEYQTAVDFTAKCNTILAAERSAFRFVGAELAKITDENELSEIETASRSTEGRAGARTHIKQALAHYSNRDAPDFRNSVKESISAVESTAKWFVGEQNATLGAALRKIEQEYGLHAALKEGFSKLYGWTNDDSGIRHALMGKDTVTEADARYMLVSCSAFCNYLVSLKAHGPRAEA
jgi:hypothetical protein